MVLLSFLFLRGGGVVFSCISKRSTYLAENYLSEIMRDAEGSFIFGGIHVAFFYCDFMKRRELKFERDFSPSNLMSRYRY